VSDAQTEPDPPVTSEPNVPAADVPVAVETPVQPATPAVSVAEDTPSADTSQEPPSVTPAPITKSIPPVSVLQRDEPIVDTAELKSRRPATAPTDAGPDKEAPGRASRFYHVIAGIVAAGLILPAVILFVRRRHLLAKLFDLHTWDRIRAHRHY
jgi:hypothetical protein